MGVLDIDYCIVKVRVDGGGSSGHPETLYGYIYSARLYKFLCRRLVH